MPDYSTADEPVAEGTDLSDAPLDTSAPEVTAPVVPDGEPWPVVIGTGFPEPPSAGLVTGPAPTAPPGYVNLATIPPLSTLTVPPDTAGGAEVVIGVDGKLVDDATAGRAYAAARTAGFNLREF